MASSGISRLYPAQIVQQLTLAQIIDANGVKTAIATDNAAANTYSGAALNGAVQALASWRLPRGLSVTTSVSAAAYNVTDAIIWTGTDWHGAALTGARLLTDTNGGQTLVAPGGFMTLTSIYVPKQLTAAGQFEFGVRDLVLDDLPYSAARQLRHGSAGDILIGMAGDDLPADPTALSPYRAALTGIEGERQDVFAIRVYGVASTTSDPITVYG